MNVYDKCPILESNKYIIRLIDPKDADDLFAVYSDKKALPYFNSDNCNGSNFYCEKKEYVKESIKYWLIDYHENKAFVRFSIISKSKEKVIGTIEMFKRPSNDYYNNSGLLRLDLRSDFENADSIYDILSLFVEPSYELFDCTKVITKAPVYAIDRIDALQKMNFIKSEEPLMNNNGDKYFYDYWQKTK